MKNDIDYKTIKCQTMINKIEQWLEERPGHNLEKTLKCFIKEFKIEQRYEDERPFSSVTYGYKVYHAMDLMEKGFNKYETLSGICL